MTELDLLKDADQRARRYIAEIETRPAFPGEEAIAGLQRFTEPLPIKGNSPESTIAMLDEAGSVATVASNGGKYFGFVVGASLPAAAAAERLSLAWDQCASSAVNSPAADAIERTAARWVLEMLDLPRSSSVSFSTSASACGLACLTAARRKLLIRQGWDFDGDGMTGAPGIKVVVSELSHITIIRALRMMGFGLSNIIRAPIDEYGRVDPERLPDLDDRTILCLQAGEVNTGEFDPFTEIIPKARAAGAWVHVDGAFGLWARTSEKKRYLTTGIENADSWTTDGHKWLNTPYDGAMGICRDPQDMAGAMNSDAVYFTASAESQKNLGIEFSRRARGIPIWAALRTLGCEGMAAMVERHCEQASNMAEGLRQTGFNVLNRCVLNQVLARLDNENATNTLREAANATGKIWFGPTIWKGEAAFRISISSWRTTDHDIDAAIALLSKLKGSAM